jgi:porin
VALMLTSISAGPAPAQTAPATTPTAPSPQATGSTAPATPGAPPAPAAPPTAVTVGPVSLTAVADLDSMTLVAGGVTPGSKLLAKAALSASYDGSSDGHDGLTALASLQFAGGGHISADNVGDIQGIDNIEARSALRIYEVWVARQYDNGKFGWKAGLTDLNADFDTQQVASLFLNSSDGTGAELGHSGINGPSIFPTTALALSGFARPSDSVVIRAGLFDGTAGTPYHPGVFAVRLSGSDGALLIGQVEKTLNNGFRVVGGGWAYTALFGALHRFDAAGNPIPLQRERGLFGMVEGTLTHAGDNGERGLSAWVRLGLGDPVVERISGYLGAGIVYTGPLAKRPGDQIGLSINRAVVDQPNLPLPTDAQRLAEAAFELTYKYNVNDWLAVQPDAQIVAHPNGDATIPTAFVVGVRFNITLTKGLFGKLAAVAP